MFDDDVSCFEVVATILSNPQSKLTTDIFSANWCKDWFNFAPGPPYPILNVIEKLLEKHELVLLNIFRAKQVTADVSDFAN